MFWNITEDQSHRNWEYFLLLNSDSFEKIHACNWKQSLWIITFTCPQRLKWDWLTWYCNWISWISRQHNSLQYKLIGLNNFNIICIRKNASCLDIYTIIKDMWENPFVWHWPQLMKCQIFPSRYSMSNISVLSN